jgi:hypothetical protein
MAGDIKLKYLSSVTLADSGLNSLAASGTYVAGYETNAVDCGALSNGPAIDILLAGHFKAAAANHNAGNIEVWVIGAENDTPTWPDVFDGTASAETVSSRNVLAACGRLAAVIAGDSSNDRVYSFAPVSVAQLFGGSLPDQFAVFVTHAIQSSTNTWASSGHAIYYTPVLAQYT